MFTGIVEQACRLVQAEDQAGMRRLVVDLSPLRQGPGAGRPPGEAAGAGPLVRLGDSVAINGVCLTVAALDGDRAAFDVVPESLACTNLGALAAGARVNTERSLRYGDRVDGHLVQGHVEASALVSAVQPVGGEVRLTVACGPDFVARTLPKGSVTVDGVSLTVAELGADSFTVALVPHTLERTTLGDRRVGDAVNLEPDMIGQWVLAALARRGLGGNGSSSSR